MTGADPPLEAPVTYIEAGQYPFTVHAEDHVLGNEDSPPAVPAVVQDPAALSRNAKLPLPVPRIASQYVVPVVIVGPLANEA